MITVENKEWRMTQGGVPGYIVLVLGEVDPLDPFAWTGTDEATQEGLHALVYTFSLTVGLRMIGRRHSERDTGEAEKLLPKVAGEDSVTV
jgi:hypothetical protein